MSYERFAHVYDELQTDIPYNLYVDWVVQHAPSSQYPKLLDIGCGTGVLSLLFAKSGYQVSGIDLSEEMLSIAAERFAGAGYHAPLYCMSMVELDGFEEIDVVTITIDSLNYVVEEHSVYTTLERIYTALRDGGQLFFDVHSLFKMNEIFLDGPFTYDDGDISYIWHTEPADFEHSVIHQMTFYVRDDASELYERFDEEHVQRTYTIEQYMAWLRAIGFSHVEITADFTDEAPDEESERIFIRAVK
ncbi:MULTISPECIES: class I SAM-dependent DNA methyltransferase [Lysinibacillus]|uniref:class I SAM-dependent DNA methyltransferase n=1 Tax=Lysinibacillus TaxID=400634 RepID=UPI001C8BFCCF|nr:MULTISPECIES: class I SAM-dependent methyltransferase [Lysinibacillus]MBX8943211.1 class I SAM-dependent methyltransferase [Lysinibacillus sp. K60]UUV23107.1 class I SAM-dependent methyltransferase [Lysinibacillus sp. FN11]UYB45972.1 class I SAM-dependent methyltransferase [Lysinibacillus capsici]WHP41997.1 class I SAM-dependent methyltransferase [Lysinibacillus boronitolerans]